MLYKNCIVADVPIYKVWKYVGSPDEWSQFHPKLVSCERISEQGGRIGSVYAMVFRMGTRTMPMRCEIIDLQPGATIQVESVGCDSRQRVVSAVLTYSLQDLGAKTRIDERIEITSPRLNRIIRAVVWLTSRFGWTQGDTTLQKLKKIAEEDGVQLWDGRVGLRD